jgi:ribosomal protein S27AE
MSTEALLLVSNLKTSTEFCPYCGSHVDLPLYGDHIECCRCGAKIPLTEYKFEPIVTKRVYDKPKDWLNDYEKYVSKDDAMKIEIDDGDMEDRPTINT